MTSKAELFNTLPKMTANSKIMLLTHTDLDGIVPEILLKTISHNVSVLYCSNAAMDEKIKMTMLDGWVDDYDFVVACDISCTIETAELIDKCPDKNKIILLDHHLTAMNLNKYDWACVYPGMVSDSFRTRYYNSDIIDKAHSSGTALLYDYLDYNKLIGDIEFLKHLTQLTSGYDTWDWNDLFGGNIDYKNLNDLFYLYGSNLFCESMLKKFESRDPHDPSVFSEQDTTLLAINKAKINETVDKIAKSFKEGHMTIEDKTYSIAICFTDSYQSDVFAAMKTNIPNKDIYMINHSNGISFRSTKEEINVADIALKYGGGGHHYASGITIPLENKIAFISDFMNATIEIEDPKR